jgi:hypothetical protein
MDSTFGILDAFAFVVFGVLILVAFVIIVSLGKLPGQLARKWGTRKRRRSTRRAGWASQRAAYSGRSLSFGRLFSSR